MEQVKWLSFQEAEKKILNTENNNWYDLAITEIRDFLLNRLSELENIYHNKEHCIEVHNRMLLFLNNLVDDFKVNEKIRDLLLESALRHDDWHVWNTYRQLVEWWEISNEEYSYLLSLKELKNILSTEDLEIIKNHILATSFWQNKQILEKTFSNNNELIEKLFRNYEANNYTEKLLVLADVWWFVNWWEEWVDESFMVINESWIYPDNFDDWLNTREWFTIYYIKPLLESLKDYFEKDYYNYLLNSLNKIIEKILNLKDKENNERKIYIEKFNLGKKIYKKN